MSTERVITSLPATEDEIQPSKLAFYCKACKKIVAAKQTKKAFQFACAECGGTEVAYGTEISIKNFYRLPAG